MDILVANALVKFLEALTTLTNAITKKVEEAQ